ncbi:MAG: hypothetical protein ACKVOG_12600 [Rhodoglobus sp.]
MAASTKLEKKANKAISRAERAIDDARRAARKLDRKTRAKAGALEKKLATAVAKSSGKIEKGAAVKVSGAKVDKAKVTKPPKPPKAAKAAKTKSPKAAKAAKGKGASSSAASVIPERASAASAQAHDYRTVSMLRGQARAAGVRGYSSMTRTQLIDVLSRA